jgi:hypothetical protein
VKTIREIQPVTHLFVFPWLLATGYWLLAAGCWLLAAGCWLLATGCWLLATKCKPYFLTIPKHLEFRENGRSGGSFPNELRRYPVYIFTAGEKTL